MNPHAHPATTPSAQRATGPGIGVHSDADQRYRCTTCGQTFAATKGPLLPLAYCG